MSRKYLLGAFLLIAFCTHVLVTQAPLFAQEAKGESIWHTNLNIFLSQVLPLPGEYNGVVADEAERGLSIVGIKLLKEDGRIAGLQPASSGDSPSTHDIIVKVLDDSLIATSKRLPVYFKRGDDGQFSFSHAELLKLLQNGTTIWFVGGRFSLPVADPDSKRVIKRLSFKFHHHSSISWDSSNNRLSWRGISVSIEPE